MTEPRIRITHYRARLLDIAVFGPEQPFEVLPTQPPLVAVEIISKDERHSEILQKLDDYRAWGVKHIWTVDPRRRRLSVFSDEGLRDVDVLALPGTNFQVSLDAVVASTEGY